MPQFRALVVPVKQSLPVRFVTVSRTESARLLKDLIGGSWEEIVFASDVMLMNAFAEETNLPVNPRAEEIAGWFATGLNWSGRVRGDVVFVGVDGEGRFVDVTEDDALEIKYAFDC